MVRRDGRETWIGTGWHHRLVGLFLVFTTSIWSSCPFPGFCPRWGFGELVSLNWPLCMYPEASCKGSHCLISNALWGGSASFVIQKVPERERHTRAQGQWGGRIVGWFRSLLFYALLSPHYSSSVWHLCSPWESLQSISIITCTFTSMFKKNNYKQKTNKSKMQVEAQGNNEIIISIYRLLKLQSCFP